MQLKSYLLKNNLLNILIPKPIYKKERINNEIKEIYKIVEQELCASKDEEEKIIFNFYQNLKPEKNSIIKQWKNLGAKIKSALDSQAFLYLYKNWCSQKRCLECCQTQF